MDKKLVEELKQHTEIVESTFEKAGLKLVQFNFVPSGNNGEDCTVMLEYSGIADGKETEFHINVNLYDGNGDIFDSNYEEVFSEEFYGYDCCEISIGYHKSALLKAKSAKIYVTRNCYYDV